VSGGHRVALRWQDFDGLGHVNHATFLTYLEEGRDAWLRDLGFPRDEYVVGRCTIEYRREIGPEHAAVVVRCAVREIGGASLTTHEQLLDEAGELLADAEFGLVMWDARERRSRLLTAAEREMLEPNMEARA
jgi:YbgC/YbaW family acyl-CoA thioester hydrolase